MDNRARELPRGRNTNTAVISESGDSEEAVRSGGGEPDSSLRLSAEEGSESKQDSHSDSAESAEKQEKTLKGEANLSESKDDDRSKARKMAPRESAGVQHDESKNPAPKSKTNPSSLQDSHGFSADTPKSSVAAVAASRASGSETSNNRSTSEDEADSKPAASETLRDGSEGEMDRKMPYRPRSGDKRDRSGTSLEKGEDQEESLEQQTQVERSETPTDERERIAARREYSRLHTAKSREKRKRDIANLEENVSTAERDLKKFLEENQKLRAQLDFVFQQLTANITRGLPVPGNTTDPQTQVVMTGLRTQSIISSQGGTTYPQAHQGATGIQPDQNPAVHQEISDQSGGGTHRLQLSQAGAPEQRHLQGFQLQPSLLHQSDFTQGQGPQQQHRAESQHVILPGLAHQESQAPPQPQPSVAEQQRSLQPYLSQLLSQHQAQNAANQTIAVSAAQPQLPCQERIQGTANAANAAPPSPQFNEAQLAQILHQFDLETLKLLLRLLSQNG